MEAQKTQDIKLSKTFTGKDALVKALKKAGYSKYPEVLKKAMETQNSPGFGGSAMVVEGKDKYGTAKVLYTFNCDIKLLNEFHPFCSIISDSPFHPAWVFADKIVYQPESRCRREDIANAQKKLGYSCLGYKI